MGNIKNEILVPKKGSLNRGRFEKFYEDKEGYVRYWGMCDVTAGDYQIFIPADVFYEFLRCFKIRSYKNIKEILKSISENEQRFLLDGISPKGWSEISTAIESIGINDHLYYSDLAVKRMLLKT